MSVEPAPVSALGTLGAALRAHGVTVWLREPARGRVLLITGRTIVLYHGGRFWWRTGRVRDGRDVLGTHTAADPVGAARRLCRLTQISEAGNGGQTALPGEDTERLSGL